MTNIDKIKKLNRKRTWSTINQVIFMIASIFYLFKGEPTNSDIIFMVFAGMIILMEEIKQQTELSVDKIAKLISLETIPELDDTPQSPNDIVDIDNFDFQGLDITKASNDEILKYIVDEGTKINGEIAKLKKRYEVILKLNNFYNNK